jgi:propanol-preferring alcohol dehydrogenase
MGMRAIAIDGGDAKRDLCMKMGAEEFIDFTKEKDVPAKIKEIADGIGAHGVLVTAYQAYNGKHRSAAAAAVVNGPL